MSAWNSAESGARLTLLADVTTANTISVTGTKTLDLNGYGIKMTDSGRVLNVSGGANLTLEDSNPNATHKYTIASPKSNGAGLAVVDDRNGSTQFTGGYITGGISSNEWGGGIQVNGGSLTMTGGTVIGNRVEGPKHGGGIAVIGASDTFKMTGGSIIGNTAAYGGGLSLMGSSSGTISGGAIKYNYTTRNGGGVHTDLTPTLTITGGMIVNNYTDGEDGGDTRRGGGIMVGNGGKGINLYGNPIIEGNQKGGVTENVYLYDNNKINITGELSNDTLIGISMQNIGVFTNSTDTDYNVATKFTSDDKHYEVGKNESGQLYLYVPPVARVTTSGGAVTEYTTLADAVTALNSAADGATLTLLGNVGISSAISVSGVKNLDLNGKTLTLNCEHAIKVPSGAVLKMSKEGSINITTDKYAIFVDGGTLNVDDVAIQSPMGGVTLQNSGTLNFNSGSLTLTNGLGTAVDVNSGSTVNISGGIIQSNKWLCAYSNGSGSNINISGGIFKEGDSSNNSKLLNAANGGTITVSGGYFTNKISTCGATIATGYVIVDSDDTDKGTKMVVSLQTISAENVTATYGDTDKKVNATVTKPETGGGTISYAVKEGSSEYIEVNPTTGALTIKKVPATGTAYVTVTAAATSGYAKTTKDVTVTINKADNPTSVSNNAVVIRDGNSIDLADNVKKNGAKGEVSYAISGESSGCTLNGSVLISGADTGSVTVNVTVAEDDDYKAMEAKSITVIIADKDPQTITAENVTVIFGETGKSVSANVTEPPTGGGDISYSVKEGAGYIDVDPSTGALTIKKTGIA
ncbi:MAG: hypothetical protein IJT37_12695, partial [Lachnospiraceae bacterium]|nr:hypothetical protein [Lachnospiraceae bacterium]